MKSKFYLLILKIGFTSLRYFQMDSAARNQKISESILLVEIPIKVYISLKIDIGLIPISDIRSGLNLRNSMSAGEENPPSSHVGTSEIASSSSPSPHLKQIIFKYLKITLL